MHNKRKILENSPYSKHYRPNIPHDRCQLVNLHQQVMKLTRKELEDKYLKLIDDNYSLKRQNLTNEDRIRKLTVKLIQMSNNSSLRNSLKSLKILNSERSKPKAYSASGQQTDSVNDIDTTNSIDLLDVKCMSRVVKPSDLITSGREDDISAVNIIDKIHDDTNNKKMNVNMNNCTLIKQQDSTDRNTTDGNNNDNDEENIKLPCTLNEIEELKSKLSEKHNIENEIIKELNEKLEACNNEKKQFQSEYEHLKTSHDIVLEQERLKYFECQAILDKEIKSSKQITIDKETLDAELKSLLLQKHEIDELKAENESLRKHRQSVSTLASELAISNEKILKLLENNKEIQQIVDNFKENEWSLKQYQTDMLRKFENLLNNHDNLVIQLEGYKTECEFLRNQNVDTQIDIQTLKLLC